MSADAFPGVGFLECYEHCHLLVGGECGLFLRLVCLRHITVAGRAGVDFTDVHFYGVNVGILLRRHDFVCRVTCWDGIT